jgi:two-component system cell cycle response regulator
VLPGLAEAAAVFEGPSPGGRVGLLAAGPSGAFPPADAIARLLGIQVTRLASAADPGVDEVDLVVIDGAGTRGDLTEGARVLSLLSDLQARGRGSPASTLVLLPSSAVETAVARPRPRAGDVLAGSVAPRELALRAHALISRRRVRHALRDQVRLGLRDALFDPLTGLTTAATPRPRCAAGRRRAARAPGGRHRPLQGGQRRLGATRRATRCSGRWPSGCAPRCAPATSSPASGGEEFLVALPGAGEEEATAVAERLRRAVLAQPFSLADPDAPKPLAPPPDGRRPTRRPSPCRSAWPPAPPRWAPRPSPPSSTAPTPPCTKPSARGRNAVSVSAAA